MVRINWTKNALFDLQEIAEYISKDSKYYALLQIKRIKIRIEILYTQVNSGSIVPEFNKPELRQLIQGNYRIIYKVVHKKQVDILLIHHASRDLKRRNYL